MLDVADPSLFRIPERVEGSMPGMQFALSIETMPAGAERERAVFQQLELGNVPDFLRTPRRIFVTAGDDDLVLYALPDVLSIGTDDDFLRMPMTPMTAQKVADLYGATLITPFLSDELWRQADIQLPPHPEPPTPAMVTVPWFVRHQESVEKQRAGRTGLVRGHKKDIVLSNELTDPAFYGKKVGIYGWHQADGKPIQGMNPSRGMPESHTHAASYMDYSHGVQLISNVVELNGEQKEFEDVAVVERFAGLVNGKAGVLSFLRYPTT